MPRIDPHQLLSCLTVLLTPTGGILSKNEVQRLANLMTKFSKKLVSKCVYVLILKNTELPLLGAFMVEGGWNLVHVWLQDGYNNKNWALVSELLELLLMSPTTVEQLKTNNLPKLVKSLSKRDDLEKVKDLANQLVQKWLKIVKEDQNQNAQAVIERAQAQTQQMPTTPTMVVSHPIHLVELPLVQVEKESTETIKEEIEDPTPISEPTQPCYKLAVRDGKHILCKVPPNEANVTVVQNAIIEDITPTEQVSEKSDDKIEDIEMKEEKESENKEPVELEKKREKSNHDRHKSKGSSSRSSSSSSRSSSSKDKDRKSGSSSSSSRDKSRDRSRSKDKSSRDKSRQDKDKHRSNGSVKDSSSKGSNSNSPSSNRDKDKTKKESKEKQAEKDKDTLTKIQPQTLQKLGRIPKKNSEDQKDEKKEDSKKPSFSIEVRKSSEDKPKTVKVFNAKMRSTGLLEEAKPPPPRPVKKAPTQLPSIPPPKRPSPIRDLIPPPEKKVKLEPIERPGAIKLIPPKPKPPVLQESDIFMDALAASATAKKEPKKRKRRISTSKESTTSSPPASPSVTPSSLTNGSPNTTPMALRGITPPNFYQDTLETTENNSEEKAKEDDEKPAEEMMENPPTPTDTESKMEVTEANINSESNSSELKGVLIHVRKKGPKKSLKWKAESELVEVQYFELDETERVNVSKPFGDMARMEITGEKQAMQMRKIQNDDNMGAQIPYRLLIEIDLKPSLAESGCKSLEKDIQFAREKSFIGLSPLIHRYAETPAEPDAQQYQVTDPVIIPLEDPENTDQEAPSQPWPEPKGSPPQVTLPNIPPTIFPNIPAPFQNFGPPPPNFPNVPNFNTANFGPPPPNMMAGPAVQNVGPPINPHDWNNMNHPGNNMNNPMVNGPMMPPDMMNPGPPMYPPKQHPDNFNQNMNDFPPPFSQPNMFPPQNNFNMRGGRGGFRAGGRGGNGPWVRMNGPGPAPGGWNQRGGGGMNRGGRLCKNVKLYGDCRNRYNCPFIHPK